MSNQKKYKVYESLLLHYQDKLLDLRSIINDNNIKSVQNIINEDSSFNANLIGACIALNIIKKSKIYIWNTDKVIDLELAAELQQTCYNKQRKYQLKP